MDAAQSGRAAARPSQTFNQLLEGIARNDDDRRVGPRRRLFGRSQSLLAWREDNVGLKRDQLRRQLGEPFEPTMSPPNLKHEVLALDIAQFAQRSSESLEARFRRRERI